MANGENRQYENIMALVIISWLMAANESGNGEIMSAKAYRFGGIRQASVISKIAKIVAAKKAAIRGIVMAGEISEMRLAGFLAGWLMARKRLSKKRNEKPSSALKRRRQNQRRRKYRRSRGVAIWREIAQLMAAWRRKPAAIISAWLAKK
jgi:hypothetical protein